MRGFGVWAFGLEFRFGLQMEKTQVLCFLIRVFVFKMCLGDGFFLDCLIEHILLGFVLRKALMFVCLLIGRLLIDMLLE